MPVIGAGGFAGLLLGGRRLIDLRAPAEFARGAFPNACSLPLLNDDERAAVGTTYKQDGQGAAIALGHRLVDGAVRAARLAGWQAAAAAHPDAVLYCWRGGLRSQTVQQWLADGGTVLARVEGGFKALRHWLMAEFERVAPTLDYRVLGGRTGTGKTRLLNAAANHVDLEGLAAHRGSSFGRRRGGQPMPIAFEHQLALAVLHAARRGGPVLVEDESRTIGRHAVPDPLFLALQRAPVAVLEAPFADRVENVRAEYVDEAIADWRATDPGQGLEHWAAGLLDAHDRIRRRLGGLRHAAIRELLVRAIDAERAGHADAPDLHRLWIAALLREYYDPMYDYQIQRKGERVVMRGDAAAVAAWLAQGTTAP